MDSVPPLDPRASVVILGAGIAGLTAGLLLARRGHKVRVLEARNLPGGRLSTIRDGLSPGLYAEAGGTYLHVQHSNALSLIEEAGLKTTRVHMGDLPAVYLMKGKRIIFPSADGAEVEWPFDFTPEERKLGPNGMSAKYTGLPKQTPALNPYARGWPPADIVETDRCTLAQMMTGRGASPAAVEFLSAGLSTLAGFGPASYSALLEVAQDRFLNNHPHGVRIVGGNDLLAKSIADRLGDVVQYGARVQKVLQKDEHVQVNIENNGTLDQIEADACLCTIPFSVLHDVKFDPPLDPEKAAAVNTFPYTSVTRIFCEFERDFWTPRGLSGLVITDSPGVVVYSDFGLFQPRGMLEVYVAGQAAQRLARQGPSEREDYALEQIAAAFPSYPRDTFVSSVSKSWDEDPFARGAYPWFLPGQMTGFLAPAVKPHGRVFFAGDHCSVLPGWIEGALLSSLHAVDKMTGSTISTLTSILKS